MRRGLRTQPVEGLLAWTRGWGEKCQILGIFSRWSRWDLLLEWMWGMQIVGRERNPGLGPEDLERGVFVN